jgi:2OG-Fe(II) oxygenase superfamily
MVISSGYFGTSSNKILKIDSIASQEDLRFIVDVASSVDIWDNTYQTEPWINRVSEHNKLYNCAPEVYSLINKIQKRFMDEVTKFYSVKVETPSPSIARWFVGNSQEPHADKTHYPDYDLGSVIYLNDEYKGGEIYFPQHNIELRPSAGNAIAFPGDEYYMHGVREITDGCRYTLPIFWKII